MSEHAKLSIALCTFNGENHLLQQLASMEAQERLPDEIVICDDCSTDNTAQLIRDFAANSKVSVKLYVNDSRLGVVKNFAKAISLCEGDYVFVSDQDDYWYPEKLSKYLEQFKRDRNIVLVASNSDVVDESLEPTGLTIWKNERFRATAYTHSENQFLATLNHAPFFGHSLAFQNKISGDIFPVPESWTYDLWISKVAAALGKISLIDESLVAYRQHQAQVVGTRNTELIAHYSNDKAIEPSYFSQERKKYVELLSRLKNLEFENSENKALVLRLLEDKISFIDQRSLMRKKPNRRFPVILRNLLNMNYFKYSRGWLTIARDLMG